MNLDIRSIIDTAGITYLLLVIAFLLVYIAAKKEHKSKRTHR